MKKHSSRAPGKNTKPIGAYNMGLTELKIRQLLNSNFFEEIVVSSDDESVLEFASSFSKTVIIPVLRDDKLCADDTLVEDLTVHAGRVCSAENVLWTHVTSPFVDSEAYRRSSAAYYEALETGYDSLVSAAKEQKFANFRGKALNYGGQDFWPRTQDLDPVIFIIPAIFLAPKSTLLSQRNRLGKNPFYHFLTGTQTFDVDTPADWALAKTLLENKY